jgi:hypothetical protein
MLKENRGLNIEDRRSQRRATFGFVFSILYLLCSAFIVAGCDSGPPPMTEDQKEQAILADPMGYKPNIPGDVTDGNDSHVGHGLRDDLNDVFNP